MAVNIVPVSTADPFPLDGYRRQLALARALREQPAPDRIYGNASGIAHVAAKALGGFLEGKAERDEEARQAEGDAYAGKAWGRILGEDGAKGEGGGSLFGAGGGESGAGPAPDKMGNLFTSSIGNVPDPEGVSGDSIRSRAEAARVSGQTADVGAKFAAALHGNRRTAENTAAAVETAAGVPIREDIEQLVEALQATGWRQPKGSATAFNDVALKDLSNGGGVGSLIQAVAAPLTKVEETAARVRPGNQTQRLADLLRSGPEGVSRLQELARRGDDRALILARILQSGRSAYEAAQ